MEPLVGGRGGGGGSHLHQSMSDYVLSLSLKTAVVNQTYSSQFYASFQTNFQSFLG